MLKVTRFHIFIIILSSIGPTVAQYANSSSPRGATQTIYVYHSDASDQAKTFVRSLLDNFKLNQPSFKIKMIDANRQTQVALEQQLAQSNRCVLTLDHISLSKILATRTKAPIFSTHVSKFDLDDYVAKYRRFGVTLSGIYQEQSLDRQLLLAKAVNDKLKTAIVIFARKTRYFLDDYRAAVIKRGLELSFTMLARNNSANKFISRQANSGGILIVVNDGLHYSPLKLPSLLMTSYKIGLPIIGNRQQDSELAAMASVFTPNKKLAAEVAHEVVSYCDAMLSSEPSEKKVRKPNFSRHFSVAINQQIAIGLNYPNLVEQELLQTILKTEQAEKESTKL